LFLSNQKKKCTKNKNKNKKKRSFSMLSRGQKEITAITSNAAVAP
jgi:hypothetical protein